MLLQYIHIILLPHDAIYFVKCTSPSCSKALPQHDAATPVLHGWDGVLRLASLPLFPPNITMVIMAKQLFFIFSSNQRTFLQKLWSFACAFATRSLACLWRFWSSGFFLAEWPFRLRRYSTRFTVYIDTFIPVSSRIFTRSFAVVLGLICTFRTKVRSSLGDRTRFLLSGMTAAWSHDVYTCVLLFIQMNVVPSGVCKLLPRMNQTCGGFQYIFWSLGWFLLMFSWCQAKRHWVWR